MFKIHCYWGKAVGRYGQLDPTDVKAKKPQTSWHHIHMCVCMYKCPEKVWNDIQPTADTGHCWGSRDIGEKRTCHCFSLYFCVHIFFFFNEYKIL